jgi:hypothetical protein
LETSKYFSPGDEPDDASLLDGLAFDPGTQTAQDMTYFDYLNRLAPLIAFLRAIGVWDLPHPWVNLSVPAVNAQTFIGETLDNLTVDDVGQGPILIYPFNRECLGDDPVPRGQSRKPCRMARWNSSQPAGEPASDFARSFALKKCVSRAAFPCFTSGSEW